LWGGGRTYEASHIHALIEVRRIIAQLENQKGRWVFNGRGERKGKRQLEGSEMVIARGVKRKNMPEFMIQVRLREVKKGSNPKRKSNRRKKYPHGVPGNANSQMKSREWYGCDLC